MTMLNIEWDWEDVARVLAEEAVEHMEHPDCDDGMPATEEQLRDVAVEAAGEVLHELVLATIEKTRAAAIAKYRQPDGSEPTPAEPMSILATPAKARKLWQLLVDVSASAPRRRAPTDDEAWIEKWHEELRKFVERVGEYAPPGKPGADYPTDEEVGMWWLGDGCRRGDIYAVAHKAIDWDRQRRANAPSPLSEDAEGT